MIIGIEGLNSCGKTTLFTRLTARGMGGVAEVSAIIPSTLDFPRNAAQARMNEGLIAGIERDRIRTAQAIRRQLNKQAVVLDRSILSTLVISLAAAEAQGWQGNARALVDHCLDAHLPGGLLPDVVLHLDAGPAVRSPRHVSRSNQLSGDWTDSRFAALQEHYYRMIYALLEQHTSCRVLRLDASRTAEEVEADALAGLSQMQSRPPDGRASAAFFKWLKHELAGN